jgi:lipopolysaccharide export system permease protein
MLAVYFPVLLIQLLGQLPRAALMSELLWPALLGLAPVIFYITLPVIVALANIWTYSELASEGTLTILYTAGLSVLNVRAPAFLVASIAVLLGFITSCILAPEGSTKFEDILYVIENDLSPSLIAPEQFHSLNGGRRVIQYQERLGKNWISGVFMQEINDEEEVIIFARDAIFDRRDQESWIILKDGYIQSRKPGDTEYDVVAFKQVTRPTGLAGLKLPKRGWTGYPELATSNFLDEYSKAQNDPLKASQWASEALERFGIPLLAFAHTLLGLALVAIWGSATGRSSKMSTVLIAGFVLLVHFLIVLGCEFASSQGVAFAFGVAVAMATEIVLAVCLFLIAVGRWSARRLVVGRASMPVASGA